MNDIDYGLYDEYQEKCKHGEWIKLCVYCGACLETSENKIYTSTGALKNKTIILHWDWDRYDEKPDNKMID